MRKFIQVLHISFLLFFLGIPAFCIDISKFYADISETFDIFSQKYEGETGFRSLLIPSGGRNEGLGNAFTALSNDSSFFDSNPAGSAILSNTEITCLHNNWIADAKLETINYSQRKNNLGWGGSFRCFYIPFTEYDELGEKKSSGFYSESFITANIAYNFFESYDFKGLTVGGNIKFGLMSMPPTARKQENGYAVLGDLGIIIRANLAKNFYDENPNFNFGIALKNFGIPIKGDIPPAYASLGFAYRPVDFFLLSLEVKQTLNLKTIKHSGLPYFSSGFMFSITKYFNLLTGFGMRGGNPHFNLGSEINLKTVQITANYTLDMASQTTALNRISIGAKISLGDDGRREKRNNFNKLYINGLKEYQAKHYQTAIEIWTKLLKLNPKFTPAKEAIEIASKQKKMNEELNKILLVK